MATLSRKRMIGSPRDGGRVSADGEILEASTGSALNGEVGATVAVILPARWSRSRTWGKKEKQMGLRC